MPLILDGTTGIVANNIADYAVTTAKLANSAITIPKIGFAGAILQVVSTSDSVQRSTNNGSMTASGCYVTITPTSSSSKIFVHFNSCGYKNTDGAGYFTIYRGATNLAGSGNQFNIISQPDRYLPVAMSYLDSPSSTSALTYEVYYYKTGSANIYIGSTNSGATYSTITVMEIAG